jgi:uncharacterized integral membrane protein
VKRFSWIISIPLLVAVVVFALANRGAVEINLWPLALRPQIPLSLVILASLIVGFLFGGWAAWFAAGRHRRRARRNNDRVQSLEHEVARLKKAAPQGHGGLPSTSGR